MAEDKKAADAGTNPVKPVMEAMARREAMYRRAQEPKREKKSVGRDRQKRDPGRTRAAPIQAPPSSNPDETAED